MIINLAQKRIGNNKCRNQKDEFKDINSLCFAQIYQPFIIVRIYKQSMNFLRGYKNSSNQSEDIGLFTFYREQAERQIQDNQKQSFKNKVKRKNINGSIQAEEKKKANKRLSVVFQSQKPKIFERKRQEQKALKIEQKDERKNFHKLIKRNIQEQGEKKKEAYVPQIFTSRKQMMLNKRFKKNQFKTPQLDKKNYLSPRSQILTLSNETKHIKTNSSQEITPSPTVDHLPNIKQRVYKKQSTESPQKMMKGEEQDEGVFKNYREIEPFINKFKVKQRHIMNIKTDEDASTAFIMISSRQHRLLTERKQIPLINALRHYSRNL